MNSTVRKLTEEIDQHLKRTPVPANELRPTYGGPQRDAINSVVDGIVGDICGKIADLRQTLDTLEKMVLEGAAGAKHVLTDHIGVCVKVNDEIIHMQEVVAEIAATAPSVK